MNDNHGSPSSSLEREVENRVKELNPDVLRRCVERARVAIEFVTEESRIDPRDFNRPTTI